MNSTALCLADVEKVSVHIDELYLDVNNPRFHGESDLKLLESSDPFDPRNQEIIRQYILKKYSATEIVDSILEVGFIPVDLIVVEEMDGKYIVVEGNRRVTALKTIHGNIQRRELHPNKETIESITSFEALKINSETGNPELKKWILQGIRHVSGVRGWGPFQQAMLIHELYYNHGLLFKDIAKTIGIHHNRVSTMLRAYLSILQMKKFDDYKDKAHSDLFSHFEQAYTKKQLRDWLEWNEEKREYVNKENLFKFYDLIISGDNSRIIMSKNIRDDLPRLYEHKELFERVMDKQITLNDAKQSLESEFETNETTESLKKCLELVRDALKNGTLNDEDIDLVCKIHNAIGA